MNDIGCSSIKIDSDIRTSNVNDFVHVDFDQIYQMIQSWNVEDLQELIKDCQRLIKLKSK